MGLPCTSLLLLLCAPQAQAPVDLSAAGTRLEAIERRLADERASWIAFRREAQSTEERSDLAEAFPREEFVTDLEEVARSVPGSEVAARAWQDLLRLGLLLDDEPLFGSALERLLADHLHSPLLPLVMQDMVYGAPGWCAPRAAEALRTILAGNDDAGVQAFGMGQLALLVGLDARFGEAGRAEALGILDRVVERFGDGDFLGMDAAEFATGARYEIEHLRVGDVAPDFTTSDQDGVEFHLSDYRGRVVVLDFWGFV